MTARHFPGRVPAATALRTVLANAGLPFSEAMLFGVAGGIGIGVAAFRYEKEDVSTFFIAGRHLWFDDLAYLTAALARLGVTPTVRETAGAKGAERQLREALAKGPCVAWVDLAHLPHRGLPAQLSGGGYHVVTVYAIRDDYALVGDLADAPTAVPLADLAAARGRIAKQKNRLLSVPSAASAPDLAGLVKAGLSACHKALTAKPGKGPLAMSTMEALRRWAERLYGAKDKEGWERLFPTGANFWRGLTAIHSYVEYYGTGGGLCRPIFADFLDEAAKALKDARLRPLAKKYAALGSGWSALANAALPDDVPAFQEAKDLYARYARLLKAGAPADQTRPVWDRLGALSAAAKTRFPLTDAECAALRRELQERVRDLLAGEEEALAAMATL
jgi:hypothetical protein